MFQMNDAVQTADWKKEKHAPALDMPGKIKKGDAVKLTVTVGKEIAHPNTTEHHIAWIDVYFRPEGEKFSCHIGRYEFQAHGGSAQGPNTSTMYTHPESTVNFKTEKSGTVFALSYCNIHGLWMNSMDLTVS
ncbi:MAG TPA: class II SORL domain-containing protein [bacterium]